VQVQVSVSLTRGRGETCRSVLTKAPSADHETRLCLAYAQRAHGNVERNLTALRCVYYVCVCVCVCVCERRAADGRVGCACAGSRQGSEANGDRLVASIADDIFAQKKYLPTHPTGV
jgi:hypothetical protein